MRSQLGSAPGHVTALLHAWRRGSAQAADELIPLVYEDLRALSTRMLRGERSDHTLRPTALVNESYLRLLGDRAELHDRKHFFALAAQAMRRVLVDHARARLAAKRAGGERVTLEDASASESPRALDLIALNAALAELQVLDPGKVRLIELRFFGGLSVDEAAEVLGVSASTAARDWRMARAWLFARLGEEAPGGEQ
jgi:RNA polymerase sigma factor (TIGR02999 family)